MEIANSPNECGFFILDNVEAIDSTEDIVTCQTPVDDIFHVPIKYLHKELNQVFKRGDKGRLVVPIELAFELKLHPNFYYNA